MVEEEPEGVSVVLVTASLAAAAMAANSGEAAGVLSSAKGLMGTSWGSELGARGRMTESAAELAGLRSASRGRMAGLERGRGYPRRFIRTEVLFLVMLKLEPVAEGRKSVPEGRKPVAEGRKPLELEPPKIEVGPLEVEFEPLEAELLEFKLLKVEVGPLEGELLEFEPRGKPVKVAVGREPVPGSVVSVGKTPAPVEVRRELRMLVLFRG